MSEHKNLTEALFAAQGEMPDLKKNATNPHFKNNYISLDSLMDQVLPVLRKNDILLTQAPALVGGGPGLSTKLEHVPTGDYTQVGMPLVLDRENPQGQGSAITYARRYALMSILGLVADEDDDGNAASSKPIARTARSQKTSAGDVQDEGYLI